MASLDECLEAVGHLGTLLEKATTDGHVGTFPDRSVALELTDLKARITGSLREGALHDIALASGRTSADATLRCTSDVLISLCSGELGFTMAWATGRLSIEAGIRDLIRLRSLL